MLTLEDKSDIVKIKRAQKIFEKEKIKRLDINNFVINI